MLTKVNILYFEFVILNKFENAAPVLQFIFLFLHAFKVLENIFRHVHTLKSGDTGYMYSWLCSNTISSCYSLLPLVHIKINMWSCFTILDCNRQFLILFYCSRTLCCDFLYECARLFFHKRIWTAKFIRVPLLLLSFFSRELWQDPDIDSNIRPLLSWC